MVEDIKYDYEQILIKYSSCKDRYALAFALIKLSVKNLMDSAPRHRIALETIRIATEEGIKWHVEEKQKNR